MGQTDVFAVTGTQPLRKRLVPYAIWLFTGSIGLLVLVSFSLGLLALTHSGGAMNPFTHLFFLPFETGLYGFVGLMVARHQPRNRIGWLLLLVGLFSALALLSSSYREFARYLLADGPSHTLSLMIWLDKWVWLIPTFVPLTCVLLLFPDGKLLSGRWYVILWAATVGLAGMILALAFYPNPLPEFGLPNPNPYGIEAARSTLEGVMNAAGALMFFGLVGSIAAVIVRYRSAHGVERLQLKWVGWATLVTVLLLIAATVFWVIDPANPLILEVGIMATSAGITLIVAAIGSAILRYNLWDINRLLSRTLVYSLLTVIVAGMYILLVTFLSVLFGGAPLLYALIATCLVAVIFQRLREVVQQHMNRLLFGERDDPYRVLQRLSARLEPVTMVHDVLPASVTAIADALSLPYVAVALLVDGRHEVVASFPEGMPKPPDDHTAIFPLVVQSEAVGQLILSQRSQSEPFTDEECQLLEIIAQQVAVAAYNVRLTTELQRSRERLVTTREEERRRLRRDLHDGLGPVLAAMSFQLDTIHNLAGREDDRVRELATELKATVQQSLSDIRRIAYNLRPPALDEMGLDGALRHFVTTTRAHSRLTCLLDIVADLPPLSAATEVAAYRIVTEAVTNAERHAGAMSCTVRLQTDAASKTLTLMIQDDGQGFSRGQYGGVGLMSMRERVAELGGKIIIDSAPGQGTCIQASLPY